jgi:hypothetical protein
VQSAFATALAVLAGGMTVHATPGSSCGSVARPEGGFVHTCVEVVYPLRTTGSVTLRPGDRVTLRFAAAPVTVLAALVDAHTGKRLAPLMANRTTRDWTITLPPRLPCGTALDVQATSGAGDEQDWWAGTRVNGCPERNGPAVLVPSAGVLLRVPPGGGEVGPLAPRSLRWRLPSANGCRVGLDARTTAIRRLAHPLSRGRGTMRWALGRTVGVAWSGATAVAVVPVARGTGCTRADRLRAWRVALAALRSARRSG